MAKYTFGLMNILEGYVRNFRRLNIHQACNNAVFTAREISYFSQLGEYLGLFSFVEDGRPPKTGRSRPMDLSWWQLNELKDKDNFHKLVLHLERENIFDKTTETIDKLFADCEDVFIPEYLIGIQIVESAEKIDKLNELVKKKNLKQMRQVLMIYRFADKAKQFHRVWAYAFNEKGRMTERKMICFIDDTDYWTMCFEEEYRKPCK